ncbi:MAG: hypothetical protein OIF54_14285 [Cohaesibacter sp.]|nr:hypothetical protein [Cohaesibacter sp.]
MLSGIGACLGKIRDLLSEFWQTNKLMSAIMIAFFLLAFAFFRDKFLCELWNELSNPKWWATNFLAFGVFTVSVGFVVLLNERHLEQKKRDKFDGWTLIKNGFSEEAKPEPIFWRDVEKFKDSDFEMWKFVKSAVSNMCWIKTKNLADAKQRWLVVPEGEKCIIINFDKMTEEDVQTWNVDDLPNGWEWSYEAESEPQKKPRRPVRLGNL